MQQKLIGIYRSVFGGPINMEILDLIRHSDGNQLHVKSKKTILEVIEDPNKTYLEDYSILCMSIGSSNTTIMGLHSLVDVKLITVAKKGCKSIWG